MKATRWDDFLFGSEDVSRRSTGLYSGRTEALVPEGPIGLEAPDSFYQAVEDILRS
jgi:hypothetical protein